MGQIVELDPRVVPLEKKLKMAGIVVVAAAASVVVIVGGLSIIAAVGVGLAALTAVNFGIPVGARYIALKKQQALTALAETFSEETVREDESSEGGRITTLENEYKIKRAELEGVQDLLRSELATEDEDSKQMIEGEISQLQSVIDNAEDILKQRKIDFAELKKTNRLLIAFHRSAKAMENSQAAERNPEELQRLETARNSIKTRMRAAVAGQTIQAMNAHIKQRPSFAKVAQLGNSKPVTLSSTTFNKEESRVPTRR